MNKETNTVIEQFIDDYKEDQNFGDLYLGAESSAIDDVDAILHSPDDLGIDPDKLHLPSNIKADFDDIWNDRINGKTLLGTDGRSQHDVALIRKAI